MLNIKIDKIKRNGQDQSCIFVKSIRHCTFAEDTKLELWLIPFVLNYLSKKRPTIILQTTIRKQMQVWTSVKMSGLMYLLLENVAHPHLIPLLVLT